MHLALQGNALLANIKSRNGLVVLAAIQRSSQEVVELLCLVVLVRLIGLWAITERNVTAGGLRLDDSCRLHLEMAALVGEGG